MRKFPSFIYPESQIYSEYKEKTAALTTKIKEQNLGPKIWHDSFDRPDGGFQLYTSNECLAIPYVSPMLAESLCDLPPLLLVRILFLDLLLNFYTDKRFNNTGDRR
jgi:hypothetical protein